MVAQVGYSVALCAVCTVHVEPRSAGLLVEPQNQVRRFVSGLASKPLGRFSSIWLQNRRRRFFPVWPQNQWLGFPYLCRYPDDRVLPRTSIKSRQWLLPPDWGQLWGCHISPRLRLPPLGSG
jgi:hypothetical protein